MDEELIKKVQPHSLKAEQSVIGSMILDADAITKATEIISREDFYQQQLGVMFQAIKELHDDGRPTDLVTLQEKLKAMDLPPQYCETEFISNLVMSVPTSTNIESYAKIVREKAVLRNLIKTTEGIANTCYLGKENLNSILEKTEKEIFQIVNKRGEKETETVKDVVISALESIERAAQNKGGVTGIASGFLDLDYKTAGFQPSTLVMIAARPAMGKTAFALNIAEYVAVKSKVPTAIFSLEMSKDELIKRLLAMNSRVDSQNIRTGNLSDDEWRALVESAGYIGNSQLILDATPGISIGELKSKCRKYKLEQGLGMVIIDYLQLMTGDKHAPSRQQEVAEISMALKALARELQIPIIALSQLSRKVEERPDKRPMMSDLRESGSIEQDADIVMFIYRDDYYNKESEDKGVAEIIIGKHRSGPTGTVKLNWQAELTRFVNKAH